MWGHQDILPTRRTLRQEPPPPRLGHIIHYFFLCSCLWGEPKVLWGSSLGLDQLQSWLRARAWTGQTCRAHLPFSVGVPRAAEPYPEGVSFHSCRLMQKHHPSALKSRDDPEF